MRGSCLFDLLAIIPFEILFATGESGDGDATRLYRLFKLLRLPRLFALLSVERFKTSLTNYLQVRMEY